MRHRMPSPVPPFDLIPASVVEAAKRLFDLVKAGSGLFRAPSELGD